MGRWVDMCSRCCHLIGILDESVGVCQYLRNLYVCSSVCAVVASRKRNTHTCIPQIRCLSAKVYNYMYIQLIAKRTSKRSQAASFVRGQETECWNSPLVSRKHGRRKLVDLGLASQSYPSIHSM